MSTKSSVLDLDALRDEALDAVAAAGSSAELDDVRVRYTGRKSAIAAAQKSLRDLSPDERRHRGQAVNAFRSAFERAFERRHGELEAAELDTRLAAERLDLTLPPPVVPPGRPHLMTQVADDIVELFLGLGYTVAEGPEAESGVFTFDLMNIPPDHPARQEMDTIYVAEGDDVVLRPHTSPVQARVMRSQPPPIAVVVPGRTYRADTLDATHSPVFTQIEGLYVDEGVTMADLRGTLLILARHVFGVDRDIRMRPSMFPFTEPSAEVDVSCPFCPSRSGHGDDGATDGSGGPDCRVCSGTGWIEILGSGMVDPQVLGDCGIDPGRYSGFAFGLGVDRIAMLRHGVPDIRDLYDGDVRFLETF